MANCVAHLGEQARIWSLVISPGCMARRTTLGKVQRGDKETVIQPSSSIAVHLVALVCLGSPNKRDKLAQPVGSRLSRHTVCGSWRKSVPSQERVYQDSPYYTLSKASFLTVSSPEEPKTVQAHIWPMRNSSAGRLCQKTKPNGGAALTRMVRHRRRRFACRDREALMLMAPWWCPGAFLFARY